MANCKYEMEVLGVVFFIFLPTINGELVQEFISGNNLFTAAVYKEIVRTSPKNVLLSPLSIEVALAAVQSGAKGETGQEIRTSLYLPKTKEETESAVKTLLPKLKGDEHYILYTANKLFIKDIPIKDQYKATITETYQSDIENIDFTQKKKAADTINEWAEIHTNNKIHYIINSDDLNDNTAAILLNALYFKGDWLQPFSKDLTSKQKFYRTSQDIIEIDMMHKTEKFFNYCNDAELDAAFLELRFQGVNASMIFVLPNQKEGIFHLENQIDKVFNEHKFEHVRLNIAIPKFKIENTIYFKDILSHLGIKKAFDRKQADFSDIAGQKGFLWIDAVKQKTFIDVSEIGVEAASVTAIEWAYAALWRDPPTEFIADHPFIFYIKLGELIFFAGKVTEPIQ